jgi:integrase/recombinase XerD
LREFAAFAADRTDPHVTAALILEWAGTAATPNSAQDRYDQARAFAMFLHAEDVQHEVPVAGLFGRSRRRRPAPHILSQNQINGILAEALLVPALSPISPQTYHTLFGLLASTGLRISEALSLRCDDLTEDGLMIRKGKFGKSRLVPLHASTRAALERYLDQRRIVRDAGHDLFVLGHGHAPTATRAHVVFVRIVRKLGYPAASHQSPHRCSVRSQGSAVLRDPRHSTRRRRPSGPLPTCRRAARPGFSQTWRTAAADNPDGLCARSARSGNLADKAKKFGIPVMKFEKGA